MLNNNDATPADVAAVYGHVELLKVLLDKTADALQHDDIEMLLHSAIYEVLSAPVNSRRLWMCAELQPLLDCADDVATCLPAADAPVPVT